LWALSFISNICPKAKDEKVIPYVTLVKALLPKFVYMCKMVVKKVTPRVTLVPPWTSKRVKVCVLHTQTQA